MSVASEITRLQNAKASLKTSINAKTDSQHKITNETIDDYADFVDSITSNDFNLPSGYTMLSYIESTGTQYIDTGYVANANTKINIKCSQIRSAGGVVFGSREAASPMDIAYALGTYSGSTTFYYDTLIDLRSSTTTGSFLELTIENSKAVFNNETFDNFSISLYPEHSITLFAINRGNSITDYSKSKIGRFRIYENNVLLHNYIPCKRNSDDVMGMYDVVENQFLTNNGTGGFGYSNSYF